jgi:hypothetical protein
MAQVRKHDTLLFHNTDEIMQRELKLVIEEQSIDSLLGNSGGPNGSHYP